MAYRKITVDGRDYEYTIGKTFVKFRGGKAVPLAEIGEVFDDEDEGVSVMVRPGLIKKYLQEQQSGAKKEAHG